MAAAGLPAVATDKIVMITVARVEPAVMDSPYNFHIAVAQIVEKSRIIKEIAVNIVDVDNIGVDFAEFSYKSACGEC